MSCETISVRKVDYYVNNPFARIIDIREDTAYIKSHIKNAISVPYDIILEYLKLDHMNVRQKESFRWFERCNKIFKDKSRIYVIYCDRGALSMVICNKMSQQGYITKTVVGGFDKYNGKYVDY